MRGARGNGGLKIAAHPHRQALQAIGFGHTRQGGEMRGRILALGRNAHQPRHGQIHRAAGGDESVQIAWQNACLLWLGTRIHLHEQLGADPARLREFRQFFGQRGAVHRMDGVEQLDRHLCLVGLQRADHVDGHRTEFGAKARPFCLRLLHIILAKQPMTRSQYRAHPVLWLHLADRDQLHRARLTAKFDLGGTNALGDFLQ